MPDTKTPFRLTGALAKRLPPAQQRWHTFMFLLLTLLCADTLYLLIHRALREVENGTEWARAATGYYQASVLLHSAIGYVLSALLLIFACLHVPAMIRMIRRRWLLALSGTLVIASFAFLVYSGSYFLVHSKSANNRLLYLGHIGISAAFLLIYCGHRLYAGGGFQMRRVAGVLAPAGALAALMLMGDVAGIVQSSDSSVAQARAPLPSAADASGFAPATGVNPAAPFFPSPVSLVSGARVVDTAAIIGIPDANLATEVRNEVDRVGYAKTRLIGAEGCARCHADIVSQWKNSAHRFSSFNNPFYVASLEFLRRTDGEPNEFIKKHLEQNGFTNVRTGQIKSQWCAGCHDPALEFEGKMRSEIDRGEVKAQAGLTCLACHQIKDIPGHTGSGNYVWNDTFKDPYLFGESNGGFMTKIHDLYLKANPEQHKSDMLKPMMRDSTFCATCHKVSLEPALNDYHFVRGQDEYDAWHNSGIALNAARTYYQPKQVRQCQACHMPLEPAVNGDLAAKDGKVLSHRFLAANTALPFIRGDDDTIQRTEAFLRGTLRISIAGLRAGDRVALTTETPKASLALGSGEAPELAVVVRNLNVGHTFPGGTNDSNQGWIEITVQDENGRPLLRGGQVGDQGQVVENTRVYNTVFIDRSGNRITRRNAQDIATPVYAAVIPPGTADLTRFRVPIKVIPADVNKVTITARVLWRKFNRTFSDFSRGSEPKSFAGVGPDLPITEIAKATADLSIERTGDGANYTLASNTDVPAEQRHLLTLDYGIGLLQQGDTVVGRKVLEDLVSRKPECANCLRTLARLYVADRDYAAARNILLEHEKRWPGDPQGAWMWANVLRAEGNDSDAIQALRRVLEVYPQDREALRLTQEINYRDGNFKAAAEAASRELIIDPEDSTAHYYAMLSARALGDADRGRLEEAAYQYYQRDESAQQMTLDFRQKDQASNLASQAIKVYDLQ